MLHKGTASDSQDGWEVEAGLWEQDERRDLRGLPPVSPTSDPRLFYLGPDIGTLLTRHLRHPCIQSIPTPCLPNSLRISQSISLSQSPLAQPWTKPPSLHHPHRGRSNCLTDFFYGKLVPHTEARITFFFMYVLLWRCL